jgi:hypothetical protein
MPRIPITKVRTTHALTIKANGHTVGLINGWNPTQGRTATPIFEVDVNNSGNPVEVVPGNISGLSVSINRFDAYLKRMEVAFGTPDLVMLTRQNQPFDVIESWSVPDPNGPIVFSVGPGLTQTTSEGPLPVQTSSPFTETERFLYSGCWFTSLGRTLRSDDNRIVNANAAIMYTKKIKVTGLAGAAATFDLLPF